MSVGEISGKWCFLGGGQALSLFSQRVCLFRPGWFDPMTHLIEVTP